MKPAPCSLAGTMSGICDSPRALRVLVEAEHGVVGRQDGAARVAENRRYTLVRQYLHDHFRAGHFLAGERMLDGGRGRLAPTRSSHGYLWGFCHGCRGA